MGDFCQLWSAQWSREQHLTPCGEPYFLGDSLVPWDQLPEENSEFLARPEDLGTHLGCPGPSLPFVPEEKVSCRLGPGM